MRLHNLIPILAIIIISYTVHATTTKSDQSTEYYYTQAQEFKKTGDYDNAIHALQQALELNQNKIALYNELASIYIMIGKTNEAIESYQQMLSYSPKNISINYNISYALKMQGDIDQSIELLKQIIKLDPSYEPAQFSLGHTYLMKGDFENGWQQHDRYLQQTHRYTPLLKSWIRNEDLTGKTIVLRPEGGYGDIIQFVRYAHTLKTLGATVVVIAPAQLMKLLSHCDYIDMLLPQGSSIASYDATTTLMSLPALFNSTEETIPVNIPYINPDPDLVNFWQTSMCNSKFKIGLCWQADVSNDASRLPVARRGIPLKLLYPLGDINNVQFYSLQQKDGTEQLTDIPDEFPIYIFDENFDKTHGSFMDTAAVMHQLNLIITVDTAIAHLAGSMGIPVWLLLPYSADWRWIAGRTDSPWYPTMRIFKQPAPFDWQTVVQDVEQELIKLTE